MLPFLKPKKLASVIMAKTQKDGSVEPMNEEGEQAPEMMRHAEMLMQAMQAKDAGKVAEAMSNMHNHLSKSTQEE